MSSVIDDINKRRTRQSVGEQPAVATVEPVAPLTRPLGDQASARAGVAPQPQVVQPQVQEPANRPMGDQASARVIAGGASVTPTAATTPVVAEPAAPKQKTYTDLYKELYKPMTPEDKAAQQKRQRNRQIINAIGDGISALANLYYTNKSGVNAYDPSTSLTKAAKERYDKLLAQQREDEERYKELAYRSGAADIEMAYRRAKDAKADALAEAEAGYKKRKEDREVAESEAKVKTEEAHQRYYDAQAKYYNSGGKKPKGTSGSSSTGSKDSIALINNDGTTTTFRKSDSVDFIHAAYTALPQEYKIPLRNNRGRIVTNDEGDPVYDEKLTSQQMLSAIARYNARELKKSGIADEDDYSQYAVGGDDYSQYIVE